MRLHRDFVETWCEIITVDFQNQRTGGIGFAHQQQAPGTFGGPVRRIDIFGTRYLAEQRAPEEYRTPARDDRTIEITDQIGQILTAFIAESINRQAIMFRRQHPDFQHRPPLSGSQTILRLERVIQRIKVQFPIFVQRQRRQIWVACRNRAIFDGPARRIA